MSIRSSQLVSIAAQLLQVKRDTSISCNINIEVLQTSNYVTLKCLSLSTCNICGNNVGSSKQGCSQTGPETESQPWKWWTCLLT